MKLTKRGKRVRALAIFGAIVLLWWVSGHVWWTEAGYCIGSIEECGL